MKVSWKKWFLILKRKWASGSQEEICGTQAVGREGFNETSCRVGGRRQEMGTMTSPGPLEEGREQWLESQRRKLHDDRPEWPWAAQGSPAGRSHRGRHLTSRSDVLLCFPLAEPTRKAETRMVLLGYTGQPPGHREGWTRVEIEQMGPTEEFWLKMGMWWLEMGVASQQQHEWNYVLCYAKAFCHVWFFATLKTVAHQAPLCMGFSRQEYWSGLPCSPPGELPNPGIEPVSPAATAQQYAFRLSHQRGPVKLQRQKEEKTYLWL